MFARQIPIMEAIHSGKLFFMLFLCWEIREMKRLLSISFWVIAILLVAVILCSLGYRFGESVFISTLFLPGALAFKYFFPKVSFKDRSSGIKDTVFIILGILVAETLFFLIAHSYISRLREGANFYDWPEMPDLLTNPVFIALILTVLAVGSYFFGAWLDRKFPKEPGPVTFVSERKPVSLRLEEILYVESNDSVTTVVATDDRRFKNKTPISQWEAILEPHFIRIHRSYLVNKAAVSGIDVDILYVGDIQLPVSRKYKDKVAELF